MNPEHHIAIDMAAHGMVSGTLAEWPLLKLALKAAGVDYPDSTTAAQLKQICGDLWTKQTKDGLPIIPGISAPTQAADGAVAQCGVCGLRIMPVMGYVCNNPRCGVFPQVSCSTGTITGGWQNE